MPRAPKPYFVCRRCKIYCRGGWPEMEEWTRHHNASGCRVGISGFDGPPPGYVSIVTTVEELAREARVMLDEPEEAPSLPDALRFTRDSFPVRAAYEEAGRGIPLRPCPKWLGTFSFRIWGGRTPDPMPFPVELADLLVHLEKQVPTQTFNTVYLQRYERNQGVKPHRDPLTNVGYTVIGTFGVGRAGGETIVQHPGNLGSFSRFTMGPGDVLVLPCTIAGQQGPRHSVSPVLVGTRWALILGTTA